MESEWSKQDIQRVGEIIRQNLAICKKHLALQLAGKPIPKTAILTEHLGPNRTAILVCMEVQ